MYAPRPPGVPPRPSIEEVIVLACLVGVCIQVLVNLLPKVF